jgi:hypothetical protein
MVVQTVLSNKGWPCWDRPIRNSEDLESFEKWFIRNFGESTAEFMYSYLKDLKLIHPSYRTLQDSKKAVRYMGRKMADQLGFSNKSKYDPRTKNTRNVWIYRNV